MAYRPISESATLQQIRTHLDNAAIMLSAGSTDKAQASIGEARTLVDALDAQVTAGIHKNPMLVTFNPKGAPIIAHDVQAILYRHQTDGLNYCHGFGNSDPGIKTRGDTLTLTGLADRTDVRAIVLEGGKAVLLRHARGLPVAEDL